jgi:nitrogen fixation protein NifB
VARTCNIQCNYCNRRFDCANESRPGVASVLLTPWQAAHYVDQAIVRQPELKVVGIAGPGDPFASPEETLETLRLVRERHPDILLCVASNGLNVAPYAEDLARLGVSHVTVTVNTVDAETGAAIYAWARDGRRIYRGSQAAALLLERQRDAIRALKRHGITVKVNTIVVAGTNEHGVPAVAAEMAALGVDFMNCMPLYPVPDTPFADRQPPGPAAMAALREGAGAHVPQMEHCTRCRADAAGLLGETPSPELVGLLLESASGPARPEDSRPYIAAASQEGLLVNQHLGGAAEFWVFDATGEEPRLVATRAAPESGGGTSRWIELADLLKDCRAVLVQAAGLTPRRILEHYGVQVLETEGLIRAALEELRRTGSLRQSPRPAGCGGGSGCRGGGGGCG